MKERIKPELATDGSVFDSLKDALQSQIQETKKEFKYCHAAPAHIHETVSPLSKDAPPQIYRGFIHLSSILLVLGNIRMVMENYQKYGLLITSYPGELVPKNEILHAFEAISSLLVNILFAFILEFIASKEYKIMNRYIFGILATVNIFLSLASSVWIVWSYLTHYYLGTCVVIPSIAIFLKLTSYHLVNSDLRLQKMNRVKETFYPNCPYPSNITLGNLLYFLVTPTLSYQPVYPRTEYIRWSFIIKRSAEALLGVIMINCIIDQFAYPTVINALHPLKELDLVGITERALKLSISSVHIWLLLFFSWNHCFLNILAELTRFADRGFYGAWWNASTMEEFWRLWNVPVHSWIKRHIYNPLSSKGVPSSISVIIVFFISGVFHEICVGAPTHVIQLWAFWGMFLQVPLIIATKEFAKRYPTSSVGNYVFWISFCIFGQPICVLLYYRAWVLKQSPTQIFWL